MRNSPVALSGENRQGRRIEMGDVAAVAHFLHPLRIGQQRTADRDQVELLALHSFDQSIETRGLRRLALERTEKVPRQAHRADADGRYAGQLLGPPGEV